MSVTRRKTLSILGGGAVLAAASAGGHAVTRPPRTALKPWALAGGYSDARMNALSYAILAPNPHNRQPWLVDLSRPKEVTLYVDTNRLLPHTDPFGRQIVVGLGCFLETLTLAAESFGLMTQIDLFPDGEDPEVLDQSRVAVVTFEPSGTSTPDPLFAQIPYRRSLKETYDLTRPVSRRTLAALEKAVTRGTHVASSNSQEDLKVLRALTADALEVEFRTPHTLKESIDLFRIGYREVDANPDGLDFTGPMFETLRLTGVFSREKSVDPGGFSFKSALKMVRDTAHTGMGYVWLTTAGNTRRDQISTGRDWVRLNLAATEMGLGVQPMSQALQEFSEMAELYAEAHKRLAPDGSVVQMLGRLGYGTDVAPSPRWPLEAKIRDA